MNGIEAAKKAGPGGIIEEGSGKVWMIDTFGDPYRMNDYGNSYYPELSLLLRNDWKVAAIETEVEPYKGKFVAMRSQVCDSCGWFAQRMLNGPSASEIATRLNATVEAAKREGIEQGRLDAKEFLDPTMTPAVAKLAEDAESLRELWDETSVAGPLRPSMELQSLKVIADYLDATKRKAERKKCYYCRNGYKHDWSKCDQCDKDGMVPA